MRKKILNEEEYKKALKELEELIDLVIEYESIYYPIDYEVLYEFEEE